MIHKNITKLFGACLLIYGLIFFIGIIVTNFVLAVKLETTSQPMLMPASLTQNNKTDIQTYWFADNGKTIKTQY